MYFPSVYMDLAEGPTESFPPCGNGSLREVLVAFVEALEVVHLYLYMLAVVKSRARVRVNGNGKFHGRHESFRGSSSSTFHERTWKRFNLPWKLVWKYNQAGKVSSMRFSTTSFR